MAVHFVRIVLLLCVVLGVSADRAALGTAGPTRSDDIDWPTYGQSYDNQRHAGTGQITPSNAAHMRPVWRFVLGPHQRVESNPVIVGRTLYITTGVGNTVFAIDAVTGKEKWQYRPTLGFVSPCCGALNRGVAVAGGRVFLATLDAQLIALDAQNGKRLWSTQIDNPRSGFSETMAPLTWNGMVFIGSSGSDYGIRGSLTAYRASDGKRIWRWYAVSPGWEGGWVRSVHGLSLHRNISEEQRTAKKFANSWQHGGGAIWMTPALDPQRGVLYATTSNPSPVFNGAVRPGDNLYTESIVAIDAQNGKLLWYYQQTPHDIWELEPASPPVLFDTIDMKGHRIEAVGEAGKTRWFYVLDRSNGRLIRLSQPWSDNADVYNLPNVHSGEKMQLPLRGTIGPIAYDPSRHFALVTSIDRPASLGNWSDELTAVNTNTGRIVWKRQLGSTHSGIHGDAIIGGALSTDDLVFVSDPFGYFYGLDASTGKVLWEYRLGLQQEIDVNAPAMVHLVHVIVDWLRPLKRRLWNQDPPSEASADVASNPVAFQTAGREYIAIGFDQHPDSNTGGATLWAFALSDR